MLTDSSTSQGYAGDISPDRAFGMLQKHEALLVDVRTSAEREWVGFVPDTPSIPWKEWPGMALNPNFDANVLALPAHLPLLMLCRSGVRSIAAAKRATELGRTAFNILGGFEGDTNAEAHRGCLAGWKVANLPWRQN